MNVNVLTNAHVYIRTHKHTVSKFMLSPKFMEANYSSKEAAVSRIVHFLFAVSYLEKACNSPGSLTEI
jgi:hypothetical protein